MGRRPELVSFSKAGDGEFYLSSSAGLHSDGIEAIFAVSPISQACLSIVKSINQRFSEVLFKPVKASYRHLESEKTVTGTCLPNVSEIIFLIDDAKSTAYTSANKSATNTLRGNLFAFKFD